MKLPLMPEIEQRHEPEWEPPAVFTRDEMDAYGAACYAAAMEAAAKVCDKERDAHARRALSGGEADRYEVAAKAAEDCADAIRACASR